MASAAIAALGTSVTLDGVTLAELTNITTPSIRTNFIDVTNHQSPSGFAEVVPGRIDGDEMQIEGNFIGGNASQAALVAANAAHTLNSYVVTFPDTGTTTFSFSGYVSSFGITAPVDGKLGFRASIKMSSLPVLA